MTTRRGREGPGHTTRVRQAVRELEGRREQRRAEGYEETTTSRFRLFMRQGPWQPGGNELQRWTWPSRVDRKQTAIDAVADLLVGRGWVAADERSWLVLCLDEAITNAMLHGNEGDPRLPIEVVVADDGRRWHVGVSDQGEGFTPAAIPDPDDPASLLLEHGRGIRLMRAWLNSLTYWRGGATVVLARKHAAAGTGRFGGK